MKNQEWSSQKYYVHYTFLHFRWRKISLVKKNGYIQQIKYTETSSKPGAIMVAYYPGNMNNNSFNYIELDSTQLNTNSLTLPRAKQFSDCQSSENPISWGDLLSLDPVNAVHQYYEAVGKISQDKSC